jgi:deoxyinosine 3'endonuclease (endonuclease V)
MRFTRDRIGVVVERGAWTISLVSIIPSSLLHQLFFIWPITLPYRPGTLRRRELPMIFKIWGKERRDQYFSPQ